MKTEEATVSESETKPEDNDVEANKASVDDVEAATDQEDVKPAEDAVEPEQAENAQAEDLAMKIAELETQLATAKEDVVRAQAEMQNVRRRAEKDVENARRYSLERMAKEILPVVDNLERALDNAGEEKSPFTEGVELTLKTLTDVLGKQSIEQLNPIGEPFDPQQHEAISMVPNPDAEPNTILNVVQKGYTLNGRVIRAAMVVVCQN